jgi:hypothetical protein
MAELPRQSWEQFYAQFAKRWKQGEHVFLNGQTGSGKTELLLRLMELRSYSCVFVTKPRDPIFTSPLARNYKRVNEFKPRSFDKRLLLSARNGDSMRNIVGNQRDIFDHALSTAYAQRGWTLGIDETLWIGNRLKLKDSIGDIAFMGRALGLTGVFATQRPAHIPVIIPQSASHAFIGKTGRKSDLLTLGELGGDVPATIAGIRSLRDQHDFLYVDTQGKMPLQVVNTRS